MLGRPLMVHTLHDIEGVLNSKENPWLTDSRIPNYQGFSQDLNRAICQRKGRKAVRSSGDVLMKSYTSHPDLSDQPSANPDLVFYTEGDSL